MPAQSLWRHRDFMALWLGQTISTLGSQFSLLALPLIAVNTLRATPAQMGVLASLGTLPFLLFGIIAGVWVDRRRRRPILIAGDAGRALVLAAIPAALLAGRLDMPVLYVTVFLAGALTVFFDVANHAYLPSLVDRDRLVEGNSKFETSSSLAQIFGPALAGWVVQAVSAAAAVALDALSFLLSGVCIALIRRPEAPPQGTGRASMLADAREGLAVVFGSPVLRSIAACTATANFFGAAAFALFVVFAVRDLRLNAASLGVVFGAGSVASLAGVLLSARLAVRFGVGPVITWSILAAGLSFVPVAAATPETALPLLLAGGLLGSAARPVYNITQVSLRQAITPLHLQGRMNATMRFVVWGTMPLGGLAGGFLGEALGLRPALAVAAAGGPLAFLWVYLSPVRSVRGASGGDVAGRRRQH